MDGTSAIPCPRLADCVHGLGPGHGWSCPGGPGQQPGTSLQEPTLTSSLLQVTPAGKQHARQHGRSEYGMGSRKYMLRNRWKRARKGLLQQGAVGTAAGNPELTGCFGTI